MASQNASLGHPLGDQNRSKNRSEMGLLKKSAQDRRRTAQDLPQTLPRAPPDPPGRPKMAPRCPRELPKAPQDALEAPFCTPGFHKKRRRPPGAAGTDFTCAPRSPKTPTKIQDRSKRAPQAPSLRGVITKARGAAGDSRARILDPAALRLAGCAVTKLTWSNLGHKLSKSITYIASQKGFHGVQTCRRPRPASEF